MLACEPMRRCAHWDVLGDPKILAFEATETALDCRYWLLYFGLKLDNILHTGMFSTGINDHLAVK